MCHLRAVRLGVVVLLVAVAMPALPGRADARPAAPSWSLARVMRALDGRRVPVAGQRVRIETDSTLCSGVGASVRVASVRRWTRFACTFTVFGARGIDRDLEFRVRVVDGRRIALTSARWIGGR
jgi:hypothetical protein